jgi:hypothetical protein
MDHTPYKKLFLTIFIHFFVMYALTYVAVNSFDHIALFSTRSFYMAVIMVAPMIILMLFFMRNMYQDKKLNIILYSVSAVVFVGSFFFIQDQIFVGNKQFLKSMIPHHSSAITMCEEASITDDEIKELCNEIISAQKKEINQMQGILERLD